MLTISTIIMRSSHHWKSLSASLSESNFKEVDAEWKSKDKWIALCLNKIYFEKGNYISKR